jgi:hypothetical protein
MREVLKKIFFKFLFPAYGVDENYLYSGGKDLSFAKQAFTKILKTNKYELVKKFEKIEPEDVDDYEFLSNVFHTLMDSNYNNFFEMFDKYTLNPNVNGFKLLRGPGEYPKYKQITSDDSTDGKETWLSGKVLFVNIESDEYKSIRGIS